MLKRTLAFAAAFIVTASTAQFAQTGQQTAPRYLTPPKEIVEAFDAPLLPQAIRLGRAGTRQVCEANSRIDERRGGIPSHEARGF